VGPRRLVAALAVSALLHLMFAAVLTLQTPRRSATREAAALIHVRLNLEDGPATAAGLPRTDAAEPKEKRRAPLSEERERPAPARQQAQPARDTIASPALPQIPDPTYYSARELDAYPRPLASLSFDYPERAARQSLSRKLLVQLLIDEHGTVREVSVVEAQPADYFEDVALPVLAAARFSPALKNGRAVKSRVLLSVSFAAAGEQ
jgi:protein TonB